MIREDRYHIYINNSCVMNNLDKEQFEHEMTNIKAFLELTNHTEDANVEYVRCEPPAASLAEGSY